MAYVVMALHSYGLCSYGLYSCIVIAYVVMAYIVMVYVDAKQCPDHAARDRGGVPHADLRTKPRTKPSTHHLSKHCAQCNADALAVGGRDASSDGAAVRLAGVGGVVRVGQLLRDVWRRDTAALARSRRRQRLPVRDGDGDRRARRGLPRRQLRRRCVRPAIVLRVRRHDSDGLEERHGAFKEAAFLAAY